MGLLPALPFGSGMRLVRAERGHREGKGLLTRLGVSPLPPGRLRAPRALIPAGTRHGGGGSHALPVGTSRPCPGGAPARLCGRTRGTLRGGRGTLTFFRRLTQLVGPVNSRARCQDGAVPTGGSPAPGN